ncbi:MAG: sugar phosphate isomerase/epimerase [Pirellulales bacterium]|nr:sugar phosphate isomerase/epimerase [Pirellulales bacterium]
MHHRLAIAAVLAIPLAWPHLASAQAFANPLFVLGNGVQDPAYPTPEAQAALLKGLGYDGIGPSGVNGIPEMLKAFDAQRLKVHALYVGANLDADQPKFDPLLKDAIAALEGHGTFVWLYIRSRQHPPSSTGGDQRAVEIVREVAEMAERAGVKVALYPHVGFYVARVEDAVRIADQVNRPSVGVTFNLCHWLKQDGPTKMQERLELALPRLFLVTINGADPEGNWDRIIQTLDRGSFDVYGFLKALKRLGYSGPIGLQCYAVPGDKRENLVRSMEAWRGFSKRLAEESK